MKQGCFITFEGADGGGKTTQVQLAAEALRRKGYDVLTSREPGGTELAEKVRAIVLSSSLPLTNVTLTLLYLAARSEHVAKVLRPALDAGRIVLCDRFSDSTLAYQGLAIGKTMAEIAELRRLNDYASQGLAPDMTLLLDGRPEVLLERRSERGITDRYEEQGLALQKKLRKGFLELAAAEPERFRVINAEGSRDEVSAQVLRAITDFLERF